MHRLALQLYTVRQQLEHAPEATLRRIREAGFQYVETAGIPPTLSPTEFGRLLRAHNLRVLSLHGPLPMLDDFAATRELAECVDCRRLIWHGWPRDERFDDPAGRDALLQEYQQAAIWATRSGWEWGLHTHWWEFTPDSGVSAVERFDRELPTNVLLQFDVYWAHVAGISPHELVKAFASRIVTLHAKDGPGMHGEPMTAIGTGVVDFAAIVAAVQTHIDRPIDWVIELDECAGDPLDAAVRSRDHLQSLLDPHGKDRRPALRT